MPYPQNGSRPEEQSGFAGESVLGILKYANLLMRRWWLIALTVAVAGGVVFWQESKRVSTFTATALLQLQAKSSPLDAINNGLSNLPRQDEIESQIEIIRSRGVLAEVVDSLQLRVVFDPSERRTDLVTLAGVASTTPQGSYVLEIDPGLVRLRHAEREVARAKPNAVLQYRGLRLLSAATNTPKRVAFDVLSEDAAMRRLDGNMSIRPGRGAGLIRVSVTDHDPHIAARAANAVAFAYLRRSAKQAREATTGRRAFIAAQMSQVADSLIAAQQLLATYQETTQTLDPKTEGGALANALMTAERDVRLLRFQEGVLASVTEALANDRTGDVGLQRIVALSKDIVPSAGDLYNKLQLLETERSRLTVSRFGYTEGGPRVEILDSLIANTRQQIRGVAEQSLSLIRSRRLENEAQIRDIRSDMDEIPSQVSALDRLKQRVDAVQKTFDLLSEKYFEAQIAEAVVEGDARIVDEAGVPGAPNPSNKTRRIALAMVIGLLAGAGIILLNDALDFRLRSPADAERIAGLPVIGAIPEFVSRNGFRQIIRPDDTTPLAEAFRSLRTTLRFLRVEHPRVIAVTSASPGDGKSVVSTNLAITLAQQGSKVLLIDGDLRRPTQHKIWNVPQVPGLSDALVGHVEMAAAVQRDAATGVHLLPCGNRTSAPAEMLGSQAFSDLLHKLRETFDVIIVDTPPVLAVADAALLTRAVDGVLLVVRLQYTNRFDVRYAVEQLRKIDAPFLGILVNGVPVRSRGYSIYGAQYGAYVPYGYHPDNEGESGSRQAWRPFKKSVG